MKKIFAFMSFLLMIGVMISPARSEDPAGLAEKKQKADALWEERGDLEKGLQAIDAYREVLKEKANEIDAAVKIAWGYWWLGKNSENDNKQRMLFHERGVEAAKKAIEIDPKSTGAHYWLAVNWAEYGNAKGIIKSISLLKPIRKELEVVKGLDEKYLKGGYYRVNARIYCKVPGILGGDRKKCFEYYRKAIEIGPDHLANHLFLAEAYLEDKEKEKAREEIDFILNAPLEPDFAPDDRLYKRQAEELLKKIKK